MHLGACDLEGGKSKTVDEKQAFFNVSSFQLASILCIIIDRQVFRQLARQMHLTKSSSVCTRVCTAALNNQCLRYIYFNKKGGDVQFYKLHASNYTYVIQAVGLTSLTPCHTQLGLSLPHNLHTYIYISCHNCCKCSIVAYAHLLHHV